MALGAACIVAFIIFRLCRVPFYQSRLVRGTPPLLVLRMNACIQALLMLRTCMLAQLLPEVLVKPPILALTIPRVIWCATACSLWHISAAARCVLLAPFQQRARLGAWL